jgi:hypothetical protein
MGASHKNLLSTTSSKVIRILQYKINILYDFASTLKFSDFSHHLKIGLWGGEKQRVFVLKCKSQDL